MMDIAVELLNKVIQMRDEEIARCHEALRMWAKFWESDDENEPLLAEEAMELTREILEGKDELG